MIRYDRSFEHDALLLVWYQELLRTNELSTTFMPKAHTLSGWLATFAAPVELYFEADDRGLYWAGWFEPGYGGVFFGLWFRQDYRTGRGLLRAHDCTMRALSGILALYPAVLGLTKQPRLLEPHRQLGYTIYDPPIPGLWGAEPAWLVVLTRENFEKGVPYGRWRKRQQQQHRHLSTTGTARSDTLQRDLAHSQ